MKIRAASETDLEAIVMVVGQARDFMHQIGNTTQWVHGYPSKEVLLNDILLGHGFVCESNDKVVGYFCFLKVFSIKVFYLNTRFLYG